MSTLIKRSIDAWSNALAAKALTTSFVAGTAFKSRGADVLVLHVTTSATVTTTTDVRVEETLDGGTTYAPLEAINSVSAGAVSQSNGVWQLPGSANGTYRATMQVTPGATIRVSMKRTGGDATSAAVAKGALYRS